MKRTSIAAAILLFSTAAFAVPPLLNYQGLLSESGGLVSGSRDMTFKIFDAASGGTLRFTETRSGANAVAVTSGIFNVLIGQLTAGGVPNSVFDGGDRYVEVTVGSTVLPRQRLVSVGYAFRSVETTTASFALTAASLTSGATASFSTVVADTLNLATGTVSSALLVAGGVKIGNSIILGPVSGTPGAPNTIVFDNGDGVIRTDNPGAGNLRLESATGTDIILSPGGNTGIGVANPTGLLSFRMGSGTGQAHALGVAHIDVVGGSVGPGTTVETPITSYTLPANALNSTGKAIRIRAWGLRNDPDGTSATGQIKAYFGASATLLVTAAPPTADITDPWTFEVILARASDGSLKAIAYCEQDSDQPVCDSQVTILTEDLTTDLQLTITGQPFNPTLSVTSEMLIVEYLN